MTTTELVGRNVRRAREQRGLTQEAVGQSLKGSLGKPWPKQAVSAAEKGRRTLTVEELLALSDVLGESVISLLSPSSPKEVITLTSGKQISGADLLGQLVPGGWERRIPPPDEVPMLAMFSDGIEKIVQGASPALALLNESFDFLEAFLNEARFQAEQRSHQEEG
jgi:transcriptional regulator with XRE-family HTH domain